MLQAHADGQSFRFYRNLCLRKIAVNVACGVARGQNDRSAKLPFHAFSRRQTLHSLHAHHGVAVCHKARHLGLEVHLPTTSDDGVAHVLNHARQLVGADVRMSVGQDACRGPVLAEHVQNLLRGSALLAAGIQLSVGVSPRTAFAKAIVALAVHLLRAGNLCQVALAVVHVLAPLQHHWFQSQLNQFQGSKQSAGTSTHHHYLWFVCHVAIGSRHIFIVGRHFVHVHTHLQVHVDGALAGIDALSQHPDVLDASCVNALLVRHIVRQQFRLGRHLWQHSQLVFLYHSSLFINSRIAFWLSRLHSWGWSIT